MTLTVNPRRRRRLSSGGPREDFRIEMVAPSGTTVRTSESGLNQPLARRTDYLLRGLLNQSVNPLSNLNTKANVSSVDRTFAGSKYRCLSVDESGMKEPGRTSLFCTPPATGDVRLMVLGSYSIEVRNQIVRFHDVSVSLKTSLTLFDKLAITGEVKELQSFDPSTSRSPELRETAPVPSDGAPSDRIVPGRPLTQQRPEYPQSARPGLAHGLVSLLAVIAPDGQVASLDVLASPSPVLSAAAMKAVRNWTFTPFLLDGKATEAEVALQVDYTTR